MEATNIDPNSLGVYGTDKAGNKTITYTRILNHPVEKVWRAISDETHRAAWFPELSFSPNALPKIGDEAIVNFSASDCPPSETEPSDIYLCCITRFEPPHLLEYEGPNEHHRFELSLHEAGCLLAFSAILPRLDEYDDDKRRIKSRYAVACGWHYKLDEMQWSLDGIAFEDEGYAGPIKTQYYFAYRALDTDES